MRRKWLCCFGARVAAQRRSDGAITNKNLSRKYSELVKEDIIETQASGGARLRIFEDKLISPRHLDNHCFHGNRFPGNRAIVTCSVTALSTLSCRQYNINYVINRMINGLYR